MKKGYIKIIIVILVMMIGAFISSSILNNNVNKIIYWSILLLFLILMVGFEKDKTMYKKDILMETVIFSFGYLIVEYLLGLFLGFVHSPYSLNILSIIKNIVPLIILIIIQELVRYVLVTKGKKNRLIPILTVMLFLIFDIVTTSSLYNLGEKVGMFDYLILSILPSLSKNVLLTYLVYIGGFIPSMVYRFILELIIYIVPIYTNLGEYVDSVFKIAFPLIFMIRLIHIFNKKDMEHIKDKKVFGKICTGILLILLFIMVGLVSGYFKYYALVIASGSMEPTINIGDVVIVKRVSSDELDSLEKGEVLVFSYENKILVHRIWNISKIDGRYVFQTKGDNNDDVDNWLVYEENVIGTGEVKIPYIGYPTVWLNNYLGI